MCNGFREMQSNQGCNQHTQCFMLQSCWQREPTPNSLPWSVTRDGGGDCALKRNTATRRDGTQARIEKISEQPALPGWPRVLWFEWHVYFSSSWFILTIHSRTNEPARELLPNSTPPSERTKAILQLRGSNLQSFVCVHEDLHTIFTWLRGFFVPEWVTFTLDSIKRGIVFFIPINAVIFVLYLEFY